MRERLCLCRPAIPRSASSSTRRARDWNPWERETCAGDGRSDLDVAPSPSQLGRAMDKSVRASSAEDASMGEWRGARNTCESSRYAQEACQRLLKKARNVSCFFRWNYPSSRQAPACSRVCLRPALRCLRWGHRVAFRTSSRVGKVPFTIPAHTKGMLLPTIRDQPLLMPFRMSMPIKP